MATPYVVPKVTLGCSEAGYCNQEIGEYDSKHCRKDLYPCRFSVNKNYSCLACDIYQSSKHGRRRSKSEGVETDPLRERNRLYEAPYDTQYWKRKIVKDYDQRYHHVTNDYQKRTNRDCCYGNNAEPLARDSDHFRNKYVSNKYREQVFNRHLPQMPREKEASSHSSSPEVSENPRSLFEPCDIYESKMPNILKQKNMKAYLDQLKRNGNCAWAENEGERNIGFHHTVRHSLRINSGYRVHNFDSKDRYYDDYYKYSKNDTVPSNKEENSRHVGSTSLRNKDLIVDAASLHDRYLHEVEVLRDKLRDLRGSPCEQGKRLRQRSESEPSSGYGSAYTDSSWEAKRAREVSPCIKETAVNHKLLPNCPQVKLPPIPVKSNSKSQSRNALTLSSTEDKDISYDSDFADEDHASAGFEDGDSRGEPEDSEDDQSVLSSLTSVSSDSNTPSAVGESLGHISLNDGIKACTVGKNSAASGEPQTTELLRTSLFSFVPPYIKFSSHDVKGDPLPVEIARHLKWKLSTITPLVIRRTLANSGFRLVRSEFDRESNDWCGTWGKHMKSFCFKTLKDYQKINHFPGTFQIGRKDRLWKNLFRLMTKFGKKEFGFTPRTYVLPQDTKLLRQAWESNCGKEKWIIKPPASARGTGIKVIHRWAQIPKKRPLIVQKYISQPYLINGSKFDLRLYVLVTSIHPLRIYIYDDGLVRFASVKYSGDTASLGDRYMHLTNYSINKLSSQYTQNEDAGACQGHKWTVKTLWAFLEKDGVDVKALWNSLVDLVIKTIISGESSISQMTHANLNSRYCSYELFGIDVLLDEALKPWLLEVNISPSLHSSSPLDLAVKGPMVRDLLNMAGYHVPNKLSTSQQEDLLKRLGFTDLMSLSFDKRIYTTVLSKEEEEKHLKHQQMNSRDEYMKEILRFLTPDDVRHLIQSEDELTQAGRFIRIFPTPETHVYHEFFESPRYYNMMFDAWENKYHTRREEGVHRLESLCRQKFHLTVPVPAPGAKSSANPPTPPSAGLTLPGQAGIEIQEKDTPPERKVLNLSSVALYRAARPRCGKLGVVLKPFPRSVYVTRRPRMGILTSHASAEPQLVTRQSESATC